MYLQLSIPESLLIEDHTEESCKSDEFMFLELFIKTKNAPQVHQFYTAMNECSDLHADVNQSGDEDEDDEKEASFMNLMAAAMSGKPSSKQMNELSTIPDMPSIPAQDFSGIDDDYYNMEIEIPLAEQISNGPKSTYQHEYNDKDNNNYDGEEEQEQEGPTGTMMLSNSGEADDLDMDMDIDIDTYGDDELDGDFGGGGGHWLSDAGMHVELIDDDVKAGVRRRRDEDDEDEEAMEQDFEEEEIDVDDDSYGYRGFATSRPNGNHGRRDHTGKWRRIG